MWLKKTSCIKWPFHIKRMHRSSDPPQSRPFNTPLLSFSFTYSLEQVFNPLSIYCRLFKYRHFVFINDSFHFIGFKEKETFWHFIFNLTLQRTHNSTKQLNMSLHMVLIRVSNTALYLWDRKIKKIRKFRRIRCFLSILGYQWIHLFIKANGSNSTTTTSLSTPTNWRLLLKWQLWQFHTDSMY